MAEENKTTAPAKVSTNAVKKAETKLPFFKRIGKWFRDMKAELKKVIWPTPKQVTTNTIISLVMMAASAVVLWGFDWLASKGVETLITLVS